MRSTPCPAFLGAPRPTRRALAAAADVVERHPVTDAGEEHAGADGGHLADRFVSDNLIRAGTSRRKLAVPVQVGPTDGRHPDAHHHLAGSGFGIGELMHGYATCLRNNNPSHVSSPPLLLASRSWRGRACTSAAPRCLRQMRQRLIILARTNSSGQCSTVRHKHGPDRRHDLLGRQ